MSKEHPNETDDFNERVSIKMDSGISEEEAIRQTKEEQDAKSSSNK